MLIGFVSTLDEWLVHHGAACTCGAEEGTAPRILARSPLGSVERKGGDVAQDAADVIEEVLRATVVPGLTARIRPMSDCELALDILDALGAAGYRLVPKEEAQS